MLEELKKQVCDANKELVRHGLVIFTWGNLSAIDRNTNIVAIKPSGVDYDQLVPDNIVLLNLQGNVVEGHCRPSSDSPTHLELYREFSTICSVVHTHSTHATAFAQANRPIKCLGTTHADHFYGQIPLAQQLSTAEIQSEYELNTGKSIVRRFVADKINPEYMPACLIPYHGPFVWGDSIDKAVYNAVVLEEVAKMNILTECCNAGTEIPRELMDKHYFRKHGSSAYYGQG